MMIKRVIFFLLCVLCFCCDCFAATINWTGIGSGLFGGTNPTAWTNADNWSPKQVPGLGDDVQIGVTTTYTNSPVISASTSINSLTFGALSSGSLTLGTNVVLTVTLDVSQKHANNNTSVSINLIGSTGSSISCRSLYVGDNTAPAAPTYLAYLLGQVNYTNLTSLNINIPTVSVSQNTVLNSTSASATVTTGVYSSNVNNPIVNINNGSLVVGQNIQTTNSAYANTALSGFNTATNVAQVINNPATNTTAGTSSVLSFGGAISTATGGIVDFYGVGAGKSTVIYSGGSAQTVYSASSTSAALGVVPGLYQNIGFSGAGTKTVQAGTITIPGDWNSAGGKIDITTNSTAFIFSGTGAQALTDASSDGGNGVVFANVNFQGSGTKTLSGKFSVAGTGVLTMAGTATLASGGNLTLISNATSSATVAAIPSGTAITGNVNVQRFVKGSSTNLSKRGYRLISSAVTTGSPGGIRSFDLNYLLNNAYISGASGGGFNAPSGTNPTLYLYREDVSGGGMTFVSGNYKGIAKINNANVYDIGTQRRFTTTNTADTTTNIPIGNGVLFFFRGDKTNNTTQTGSKVTSPFDYPEDVVFTQTGTLNTGTVNVKQWYRPDYNLTFTNNSAINNATVRGYTLVGNPYAATINFEKFNRNGTNSSIYGGGFPAANVTRGKMWVFNPTTKQYDAYTQGNAPTTAADTSTTINPTGSIQTGSASNMIASGQGFFMQATTTGQTLSFRESAKTATQPSSSNLNILMSTGGYQAKLSSVVPDAPTAMLKFRLVKDTINSDEVVLALDQTAGEQFSKTDDVEDLHGNGALVSLSLLSSDKVSAAIKRLQFPQAQQRVIALAADATTTGIYEIKLVDIRDLAPEYEVWLKDKFTGDSLDVKLHDTYTFNINKADAATFGSERFTIVVRQNPALMMRALSFDATKTKVGSQLRWTTENESTDYLFDVHRSNDGGLSYKNIGQIESSGLGSYTYLDANPVKGANQYRVGIHHIKNNTTNYTNPVSLMYSDTSATEVVGISVYPNPTVQMVNIKIPEPNTGRLASSYTINIMNSSGRVIKQHTTSQPTWQENVGELLPGTYIVQVINNRDNKVEGKTKFVKL